MEKAGFVPAFFVAVLLCAFLPSVETTRGILDGFSPCGDPCSRGCRIPLPYAATLNTSCSFREVAHSAANGSRFQRAARALRRVVAKLWLDGDEANLYDHLDSVKIGEAVVKANIPKLDSAFIAAQRSRSVTADQAPRCVAPAPATALFVNSMVASIPFTDTCAPRGTRAAMHAQRLSSMRALIDKLSNGVMF
jgi:hypothetical protein